MRFGRDFRIVVWKFKDNCVCFCAQQCCNRVKLNLRLYNYKTRLGLKATANHPHAKRHESITANEPDRDVFPSIPTLSSILLSLDPIELLPLSLARSEGEEHSQTNTDSRGFAEAFLDYILPER